MFKKKNRQEISTYNIVNKEEYIDEDNYKGNINIEDIFPSNNDNKNDKNTKKRLKCRPTKLIIPVNTEENIIKESVDNDSPSISPDNKRIRIKSEYHTFVKEKVEFLKINSPEIIGRNRFKYAIELWNEVKQNKK
jgi:hypothetical protein